MAQLVIAAAGAAVGFAVAGPAGAKWGWMAGSLVGAAFSPAQKSQGPRLSDLTVAGSSYGTPLPYVQGHPRIAGTVIWASDRRELTTTSSSGKGGNAEHTTYTYEVDLLIELTDNEIAGVSRIWSNGKLIYNILSGANAVPVNTNDNTDKWSRMTVYTGAPTQLPDPDYEAAVGTANAPAYRGRGSVFIKSLGLGSSGAIPNLTFEVTTGATTAESVFIVTMPGLVEANPLSTEAIADVIAITRPPDAESIFDVCSIYLPNAKRFWVPRYANFESGILHKINSSTQAVEDSIPGPWRGTIYKIVAPLDESCLYLITYDDRNIYKVDLSTRVVSIAITMQDINPGFPTWSFYADEMILNRAGTILAIGIERSDLSTGQTDQIRFYNPVAGTLLAEIDIPDIFDDFFTFLFNADESVLYVAVDRSVLAINMATYSVVAELALRPSVGAFGTPGGLALSPDGTKLYIGQIFLPEILIYSVPSNTLLSTVTLPEDIIRPNIGSFRDGDTIYPSISDMTMSADGLKIYCASYVDDICFVFNTATNDLGDFFFYGVSEPGVLWLAPGSSITLVKPTLEDVVTAVCLRSGMAAADFDATALAAITTPVHAMAISTVSTARNTLDMLASAYFFTAVASDKLYFRPRGQAAAVTLEFDDLGNALVGSAVPESLPLSAGNDMEVPSQVALTYSNVDGDYQTDTQNSDRLLTDQINVSAVQLPLAFTPTEAKALADKLVMDGAVSALTTSITVSRRYERLEPSDVINATGYDGSTYRLRLMRRAESDGVLKFDAVVDDASVLTQSGITSAGIVGQTNVSFVQSTTLQLLDIPLLRDADNQPGFYYAVEGSATGWRGATVYTSWDNVTYTEAAVTATAQIVGRVTTLPIPGWAGGDVFDESSVLTVDIGAVGELVSVTRDEILASSLVNAAWMGSSYGNSGEIFQFRTATLISAGVYRLTGLLRGRRGTEYTFGTFSTLAVDAPNFVLLNKAAPFLTLQTSDLGRNRYFKVVTPGQRLSEAAPQELTMASNNLQPLTVIDVRANRNTTDTVITWVRRTRLSTRLTGTLPISAPLGEASESYSVQILSDSGEWSASVMRTLTSSTPTVTYTSAQQVTDFGAAQTVLYLRIHQISAIVGQSYPTFATV